jgi:hypothetical protein
MDLSYRKTVSHLNDLKYASKKASELLEEVKEQEWKNSHVAFTHSILLFLVLSIVSIYLLYKLYTYMRQRAAIWPCGKAIPATPTDVANTAKHGDKGNTVNINIRNSNDTL